MILTVDLCDGPVRNTPRRSDVAAGAVLVFEGIVRPDEEGRPILGLDYKAYDPMARAEFHRLGEFMMREFDLLEVNVQHSRGFVPAGECSFRLVVASKHRQSALAATDWFIAAMKRDVPIWKTPVFMGQDRAMEGVRL